MLARNTPGKLQGRFPWERLLRRRHKFSMMMERSLMTPPTQSINPRRAAALFSRQRAALGLSGSGNHRGMQTVPAYEHGAAGPDEQKTPFGANKTRGRTPNPAIGEFSTRMTLACCQAISPGFYNGRIYTAFYSGRSFLLKEDAPFNRQWLDDRSRGPLGLLHFPRRPSTLHMPSSRPTNQHKLDADWGKLN